jgi:uncharacterized protein (TIGR02271 family)
VLIRRAVGVFRDRNDAERALQKLKDSGFPMSQVSVVAKDAKHHASLSGAEVNRSAQGHHDNKADDGAKVGALSGGTIGGIAGLLVGIGALAIPGIGPVMLAGAAATALATTATGTAIGAATGSILGGLVGMGIPEDRAKVYNDRVSNGGYLVVIDGSDAEINRAADTLGQHGVQDWGVYGVEVDAASVPEPTVAPMAVATPSASLPVAPQLTAKATVAPPSHSDAPPSHSDDTVKLYEERVIVSKEREKAGDVSIGKHVEVETSRVSVPIERERVMVERVPSTSAAAVPVGADDFQNGEIVQMDVYEEAADIHKETFVREEINIHKEVEREVVNVEETVRREELDVDVEGNPTVKDIVNHDRR